MRITRLYIRSIPRRLKRLWLTATLRTPYQCDGCLDWFTKDGVELTPSPYCKYHNRPGGVVCGAYVCRKCRRSNYEGPSCYCDC